MEETKNVLYEEKIKQLPNIGENVEGLVIANEKNTLYVDLAPFGTGIIFGREYLIIKDLLKDIAPGMTIKAKIIDIEGEKGYIELSLKEAKEAEVWVAAQKAMEEKKVLSLSIKEANKGGLIINWQGLIGFLPVSQLSQDNYPKVVGGDKSRILTELEKLVGEKLSVNIITVEPEEKSLIFSQKNIQEVNTLGVSGDEGKKPIKKIEKNPVSMMEKYALRDVLEAKVIGVADFGIFVKLSDNDEGLVHVSEISWSLIGHPKSLYRTGDKVTVKVIEINKDKVSLSIKALTDSPWKSIEGKYEVGNKVKAVVVKISEHGALASVEEGVCGLIHVSEFQNVNKMKEKIKLGNNYDFNIKMFDWEANKMILILED